MPLLDTANLLTKGLLYAVSLGAIGAALHGTLERFDRNESRFGIPISGEV